MEDGINGEELRKFIAGDEITFKGVIREGLIKYLRSFVGSADDLQRVIGDVFTGVQSRMESGYLLRDIVNKVNGIHFDSSEEIHTRGHLYESMLKEMRAAGDSGEFYTPWAIVRFIVEATNPGSAKRFSILPPAPEASSSKPSHLEKQCRCRRVSLQVVRPVTASVSILCMPEVSSA